MRPLRVLRDTLCVAIAVAVTAPAWADDIAPPPYRGAPHSVMAKFDLFGGQQPGGPSSFNAVGGTYPLDPLMPAVGTPFTDPTNNALIYPIALPNFIDPLPLKRIRVQYSWFGALPGTGPTGDAATVAILPSPGGVIQQVGGTTPQIVGAPNIYHRWDDFEIIPNPDSERFEIAFINADPRWLVIDTISIPEPASVILALTCLGLAGLRRR